VKAKTKPAPKENVTVVSVSLPPSILLQAVELAKKQQRSFSNLVLVALTHQIAMDQ
jgi:hypothetical protein